MNIRIDIDGLDDMIKAMRDIQTQGVQRAQRDLDDALDVVAETSRDLAHEHTSALKLSQSHSSEHLPMGWSGIVAYDSRGAAFEVARGSTHSAFIDELSTLSAVEIEAALDGLFRDL